MRSTYTESTSQRMEPQDRARNAEITRAAEDGRRRAGLSVWILLALNVAWYGAMGQFEAGPVYWTVGAYALLVMLVLFITHGPALRSLLVPRWRFFAIGAAAGVGMTLLTYPAYWLAVFLFPELEGHVAELYAASHQESLAVESLLVIVILTAEELLWRGAWLETLMPKRSELTAACIAVGLYSLAQLGSGSWIVFALALSCGALWTAMRLATGSLIPPLVSHMIWTPVVILYVPLV